MIKDLKDKLMKGKADLPDKKKEDDVPEAPSVVEKNLSKRQKGTMYIAVSTPLGGGKNLRGQTVPAGTFRVIGEAVSTNAALGQMNSDLHFLFTEDGSKTVKARYRDGREMEFPADKEVGR